MVQSAEAWSWLREAVSSSVLATVRSLETGCLLLVLASAHLLADLEQGLPCASVSSSVKGQGG